MTEQEKKDLKIVLSIIVFLIYLEGCIISTGLNTYAKTNLTVIDGILIFLAIMLLFAVRIAYDVWKEKK